MSNAHNRVAQATHDPPVTETSQTPKEAAMTVKELIRRLSELPQELGVVIDFVLIDENRDADDNGYADVTGAGLIEAERPTGEGEFVTLEL